MVIPWRVALKTLGLANPDPVGQIATLQVGRVTNN